MAFLSSGNTPYLVNYSMVKLPFTKRLGPEYALNVLSSLKPTMFEKLLIKESRFIAHLTVLLSFLSSYTTLLAIKLAIPGSLNFS